MPQAPDFTDTKRIKPYGKSNEDTNARRLVNRWANDVIKFAMILTSSEDLLWILRDAPKLNIREQPAGLIESASELRIAVQNRLSSIRRTFLRR